MKKIIIATIFGVMGLMSACANDVSMRSELRQSNAVQNVINEQIAKEEQAVNAQSAADFAQKENSVSERNQDSNPVLQEFTNKETTLDPISEAMESIQNSRIAEENKSREEQMALMKSTEGVDFDLTKMSPDMVYAMVYQMMTEPATYEGKVFRINGTYYASFFETNNQYYHYCIIKDALACCTQGMEFIWGDGTHAYPDEFPNEGDVVEITGTFETYSEGDGRLYCRLNHSELVKKSGSAGM